jgi:hypothetical protein
MVFKIYPFEEGIARTAFPGETANSNGSAPAAASFLTML